MTDRHQTKPYPLRMPEELRAKLEAVAQAGGRSLHQEILMRLERTVSDDPVISGVSIAEVFLKLEEVQKMIADGRFVPFTQTDAGKAWQSGRKARK